MLSGPEIRHQIEEGKIEIERVLGNGSTEPWDGQWVGPNSVDLHMADELWIYDRDTRVMVDPHRNGRKAINQKAIDPLNVPALVKVPKTELNRQYHVLNEAEYGTYRTGLDRFAYALRPGILYLGRTLERVRAQGFVPELHGRSSLGRLGVFCNVTAAFGDDDHDGTWTLEFAVVEPVLLYPWPHPLSRIVQMSFCRIDGERWPYKGRYQHQHWATGSRIADDIKR